MKLPSRWTPCLLQIGVFVCGPLVFAIFSAPSLTKAEIHDRSIRVGVCPVRESSLLDAFQEGARPTKAASLKSLASEDEDDDDDSVNEFEGGGLAGEFASLLTGLAGKVGMESLSGQATDLLGGLPSSIDEGKGGAVLKEALNSLSGMLGGGRPGMNGFSSSSLEDLMKAAAGPLMSGNENDFLEKLQGLLSENSPELKGLLDELVDNPYMDTEEISMPPVTPDVYAPKDSADERIPDSLENKATQPVRRPKPVVLRKVRSFAEAPEELFAAQDEESLCHVLVLSGAGVKGAFQAGAIVGLAEQYKATGGQLRWDVVSGVSFGGVAAAFSLAFEPGHDGEMDFGRSLWSFWRNLRFEDVLRCKEGMRDLMDIPATLKWVNESYKLWREKHKFSTLSTAHPCDSSPYQRTLREQLTSHLKTSHGEAVNCANRRVATLTAAILGGGEKNFFFTSSDVDGICQAAAGNTDDTNRIDPVLTAMLATSATPGTFPLVKLTPTKVKREEGTDEWDGRQEQEDKATAREESEPNGEKTDRGTVGKKRDHTGRQGPRRDEESSIEETEEEILVDGSLTSYLNITPAIKACQEKLKASRQVQSTAQNTPKKQLDEIGATLKGITEDELSDKDIANGKNIVFDFIVANELATTAVDETIEELFDSDDDVFDNAAPALTNIRTLAASFPQARIRHVISFEETAEVAHDVMDLRSVNALLEHGRVNGWKAATLKSVNAAKD